MPLPGSQFSRIHLNLWAFAHGWQCNHADTSLADASQVTLLRAALPSSARKDGIALEAQLSHFLQMLEEGNDAEAAYLAEQLLIHQMQYLVTM